MRTKTYLQRSYFSCRFLKGLVSFIITTLILLIIILKSEIASAQVINIHQEFKIRFNQIPIDLKCLRFRPNVVYLEFSSLEKFGYKTYATYNLKKKTWDVLGSFQNVECYGLINDSTWLLVENPGNVGIRSYFLSYRKGEGIVTTTLSEFLGRASTEPLELHSIKTNEGIIFAEKSTQKIFYCDIKLKSEKDITERFTTDYTLKITGVTGINNYFGLAYESPNVFYPFLQTNTRIIKFLGRSKAVVIGDSKGNILWGNWQTSDLNEPRVFKFNINNQPVGSDGPVWTDVFPDYACYISDVNNEYVSGMRQNEPFVFINEKLFMLNQLIEKLNWPFIKIQKVEKLSGNGSAYITAVSKDGKTQDFIIDLNILNKIKL